MKTRSKIKTAAIAVTVASGFLVGQAHASLGTVTTNGYTYVGGNASGQVQVNALPAPMSSASGGGGIFTFNRTGGTAPALIPDNNNVGNFVAICLEFSEGLINPGTYDLNNLEAAPINGSAAPTMIAAGQLGTRADDLRYFLGHVFPNFGGSVQNTTVMGISAADAALAVQLVVWEIANENYGNGVNQYAYNLGTGFLQVTSAAANALTQANAWLGALNNSWNKLNDVYAIINKVTPGQDFVVQVTDPNQVVPLPAAVWLLGSGLIGLVGLGRRRKTAA